MASRGEDVDVEVGVQVDVWRRRRTVYGVVCAICSAVVCKKGRVGSCGVVW